MRNFFFAATILILLVSPVFLSGQSAPDFTLTDSEGNDHSLYADYLDQGTTVVLKFFFVNCPPCNAIAPKVQELYVEWGEGEYDVQFIELTTLGSDDSGDVAGYKSQHGLTFPGIGSDGGSLGAVLPYRNGDFGPYRGTPSFAVISPDGTVVYGTGGAGTSGKIANLDAAIAASGAQGDGSNQTQPALFSISLQDAFGNEADNVEVYIENAVNDNNLRYPLTANSLTITDVESQYPGITEPVLRFRKSGPASEKVSPLDMLLLRKHLLNIIPISDDEMTLAADLSGDGAISPLDLLIMRKLILNIITEFPVPTYRFLPDHVPLDVTPGSSHDIQVKTVKIGDLNGF